jgi:hypothetical protein
MRDIWYADKRDLVKWGVLFCLAESVEAVRILQLAFYRPSEVGRLVLDGQEQDIPEEVIAHFRNLRTIGSVASDIRVTVSDPVLEERTPHLQAILALLRAFAQERCIVFLDPDTGLASEARTIWKAMKGGDVFAFYQHQTNRAGQPWIEPKQHQLAETLEVEINAVKVASGPTIANDVVIFYMQKA